MKVEKITKIIDAELGFKITLFENLSFEIVDNAITSLVAPYGSGKSSILKSLAGLDKDAEKSCAIKDSVYIPSESSSFPWMNVAENIKFGKMDIEPDQIKNLCILVGLDGYENHFPNNRSLGFRLRLALARSLAVNPKLIYLDEPFNKMDYQTKLEMYQLLIDINYKLNSTFLLATTNLSEAAVLSKKIHLLKNSPLELSKTLNCELDEKDIMGRLKSSKYSEIISSIEGLNNSDKEQQLFSISI